MNVAEHSSFILHNSSFRPPNREKRSIARPKLHDDSILHLRVRLTIHQHHPPRFPPSLPASGVGDVHRFIAGVAVLRGDGDGARARIIGKNAAVRA